MKTSNDLREVFRALIAALEEAKKDAQPELLEAVEKWGENVRNLARIYLARPSWLLTPSIIDKVVDYDKSSKIWAIAGFQKTTGGKNTPGSYGQYHEAGWAPDRRRPSSPDHFLKRAKIEKGPELRRDVEAALKDVLKVFNETIKNKRS